MDVAEGHCVIFLQLHEVCHCIVHGSCAQAAKGRNHQRTAGQSQLLFRLLLRSRDKLPADRHAHYLNFFGIAVILSAFFKADQNPIGPVGCHFGGQSGDCIAFVDTGRNLQLAAGIQRRKAGITTGTHDHIRLKLPNDLLALLDRAGQIADHAGILFQSLQALAPHQTGTGETFQLIPRLRHQLFFHVTLGSDKQHLTVGVTLFEYIRYGNGRIDMSCCTAAGKDHIHFKTS